MDSSWTADDVPDQTGRVAIVTGANGGIGFETAAALADNGAHVVLAVRNADKGRDAVARIRARTPAAAVTVQTLDLASLDSIRSAADELRSTHPRIDLMINNAGVMSTQRSATTDGFELHLGTNHLGHFALTGLLLDRLLPLKGSRVVTMGSLGDRPGRIHLDDLQLERDFAGLAAYQQSKLANLMFTYELNRRLAETGAPTVAVAAHPGFCDTDIMRHMSRWIRWPARAFGGLVALSPEAGALPLLRAATDHGVSGGEYYGPGGIAQCRGYPKVIQSKPHSHDREVQRQLWAVSELLTGVPFPV